MCWCRVWPGPPHKEVWPLSARVIRPTEPSWSLIMALLGQHRGSSDLARLSSAKQQQQLLSRLMLMHVRSSSGTIIIFINIIIKERFCSVSAVQISQPMYHSTFNRKRSDCKCITAPIWIRFLWIFIAEVECFYTGMFSKILETFSRALLRGV